MNLFNGNIRPAERKPLDFPLREHYSKEFNKLKEQLDCLLNEDNKELLNNLLDMQLSETEYSDYSSFIFAFRLAALLMIEIFHDKDSLLYNKENHLQHNMVGKPN